LFGKEFAGAHDRDPIFVTSLPRAGTTILLTALCDLPEFASHTYRDMPFVMAPVLWSKMSRSFQKDQTMKQRAHGDGIQFGYDSPEAFEEIVWKNFWPSNYKGDRIDTWVGSSTNAEATEFFRKHFAKIVALRCKDRMESGRYISKNNCNIARLDLIPIMFPDAKIVMPIRSPMEHAASLHRQHSNFLERHKTDVFAKRYMRDIGHFEFGELHKPIMFPGLAETLPDFSPTTLDYWLNYWIAGFKFAAERRSSLIVVAHEQVCTDSVSTISRLFEELNFSNTTMVDRVSSHFKPIAARTDRYPDHSRALRDQAEALYAVFLDA
jgi:hypothetical protein